MFLVAKNAVQERKQKRLRLARTRTGGHKEPLPLRHGVALVLDASGGVGRGSAARSRIAVA